MVARAQPQVRLSVKLCLTVWLMGAQAIRTITALPEVFAFLQVAQTCADIGEAVQELTISLLPSALADAASRNTFVPTIRNALRRTPNLTDLTLLLPKTTPAAIFFQISFPHLKLFKTNLPHSVIRQFLTQNNSISDLVVGPCNSRGQCPLQDVDLEHMTTLECHAGCLSALAHPGLVHLAVENHDPSCHMSVALCKLPVVMRNLYSLTLDVISDDTNLLFTVSLVAPRVRKLKLLEKRRLVSGIAIVSLHPAHSDPTGSPQSGLLASRV